MNNYIQQAFNEIIEQPLIPETWYVCLMEKVQFYGGQEEGGWWGDDCYVVSYCEVASEDIANQLKTKIETLAQELTEESRKAYGEQCLRECDWLEARGLDADFLPEPDGPSEFYVLVSDHLLQTQLGTRQYS